MKHKKYLFTILLLIIIGAISCKKNAPASTNSAETPGQLLINNPAIGIVEINPEPSFAHELGITISFLKAGTIRKLGCFMASEGNFTVSLWDLNTKNKLREASVNITDITKFAYADISPIEVNKDTKYVISVNTYDGGKKAYYSIKSNNTPFYPFIVGNIKFENNRDKHTEVSSFPNAEHIDHMLPGIADLGFEPK